MGYTMDPDPEITAKALGKELQISPKESVEICDMLRSKDVDTAIDILEDVIDGDRAVPYKKHNKKKAHQKGSGPGGYPKKAAKKIRDLLEEAKHNAESKGLDSESMDIIGLAAHQGEVMEGRRSRAFGRSSPFDTKTTNVEVILKEKEE